MILKKILRKILRKIRQIRQEKLDRLFEHELVLQNGLTVDDFRSYLEDAHLSGSGPREIAELKNYLNEDFGRFCYTFSLLPDIDSPYRVLEIGGNPYYMTALMKKFTNYDVKCSNFFRDDDLSYYWAAQTLICGGEEIRMDSVNLNIEKNYYCEDGQPMDLVCFCEVIEHLIESPVKALLNVNKMLKQDGYLILSTPNVCRIENVARMIAGANLYDPYSGYGLYGRHNREFSRHEINLLLNLCGFEAEVMFTSDVHQEYAHNYYNVGKLMKLINTVPNRNADLGQYIFVRARKIRDVDAVELPDWLNRSRNDMTETPGSNVADA